MRPKLKEESTEIDKMSVHLLNYYQDAEAHIDAQEKEIDDLENENEYISTQEIIIKTLEEKLEKARKNIPPLSFSISKGGKKEIVAVFDGVDPDNPINAITYDGKTIYPDKQEQQIKELEGLVRWGLQLTKQSIDPSATDFQLKGKRSLK